MDQLARFDHAFGLADGGSGEDEIAPPGESDDRLLELDNALQKFTEYDTQKAHYVKLRYSASYLPFCW